MHYRIHGKQAYLSHIDSPAGRFDYRYEPVPGGGDGGDDGDHGNDTGKDTEPAGPRPTGLSRPDGMRRLYLHEPRHQAGNQRHLTGILIASAAGKHPRRLNPWASDNAARPTLALQGPPPPSTD